MSIRFVIRPAHIRTTPRLLKEALGAERTLRWPGPSNRKPSWIKDFFLTYPAPEELQEYAESHRNAQLFRRHTTASTILDTGRHQDFSLGWLDSYNLAREFASVSKPAQRRILSESCGFPVPWTSYVSGTRTLTFGASLAVREPSDGSMGAIGSTAPTHIARPFRHTGGQEYHLRSNATDYDPQREYIQEIYPKKHEYRIIAIRGVPLITLYKRRPDHLSYTDAWNHTNGSTFVTVTNPDNDRLRHTNVYDLVRNCDLFKVIDLAGIDIMLARQGQYVITEVNLCPAVTLPDNLERIKQHALSPAFLVR